MQPLTTGLRCAVAFHPGLPPNYDGAKSWSNLTAYPYINQYLDGDNCGSGSPDFPAWGRWCEQDASQHQFGDDLSTNITLQHLRAAKNDPLKRPFFIAVGYHRYPEPQHFPLFLDLSGGIGL